MSFVKQIPIESITFPPVNLAARPCPKEADKDWPKFLEFAQDIENRGLDNLFSVRVEGDKYCVIDGTRRAFALKMLWEKGAPKTCERYANGINVQVQELSDVDALGSQIGSNHQNFKQPDAQLAKAIYKYMVSANKSLEETAAHVGYSVSHLQNVLNLNTLPEAAQKALNEGKMTLTNAFQLAKLPADHQDGEWLEKAMTQKGEEFVAEVAKSLNEIKKEKRLGADARPTEFAPTARLLSKEAMAVMLEQAAYTYKNEPTDYNRGCAETLQKIFQLDEQSIATAKAEWEKQKAEADQKKETRKADREKKQLEEAQKFIAEHGGEVKFN